MTTKEPTHMRLRIKSIARRFTAERFHDDVHFHGDADGRLFVCDNARCESPGVDVSRD